jgi:hypothetical protein
LFKHFILFSASGWWYYQIKNKLKAVVCQGKKYNYEIDKNMACLPAFIKEGK